MQKDEVTFGQDLYVLSTTVKVELPQEEASCECRAEG